MKATLYPVFQTIWKRRERKLFLLFSFYPLLYMASSFFEESNFMKISSEGGVKLSYLEFVEILFNSVDMTALPMIALALLVYAVFRKEIEDHTLFLYKDVSRKTIFSSKFMSLMIILLLYVSGFILVSLLVFYSRVVPMGLGIGRLFPTEMMYLTPTLYGLFSIFLKGLVVISLTALLSMNYGLGLTMTVIIVFYLAMSLLSLIGSPFALVLPNGYRQFIIDHPTELFPFLVSIVLTFIYSLTFNGLASRIFQKVEF